MDGVGNRQHHDAIILWTLAGGCVQPSLTKVMSKLRSFSEHCCWNFFGLTVNAKRGCRVSLINDLWLGTVRASVLAMWITSLLPCRLVCAIRIVSLLKEEPLVCTCDNDSSIPVVGSM